MNTIDMMLARQVPAKASGPNANAANPAQTDKGAGFATALMGHIHQAQAKAVDGEAEDGTAETQGKPNRSGKDGGKSLLFADEKALMALFAHLRASPRDDDDAAAAEEVLAPGASLDNEALAKALAALLGIQTPAEDTVEADGGGALAANDNPAGKDAAATADAGKKRSRPADSDAVQSRPADKNTVTVLAMGSDAVDEAPAEAPVAKSAARPELAGLADVAARTAPAAAGAAAAATRMPGAVDARLRASPDVAVSEAAETDGAAAEKAQSGKPLSAAERSRTFLRAEPDMQTADDEMPAVADLRSQASGQATAGPSTASRGVSELGRDVARPAGPPVTSQVAAALVSEQQKSQPMTMLKIQLNPLSLGHVTAVMKLSGDVLNVELQVETADAYRQLTEDSQAIVKSLRAQGYGVDQVTINHVVTDRSAGAQPDQNSGFSANSQSGQGDQRQAAGQTSANGSGERGNTPGNNQSNQSGTPAHETASSSVPAAGRNDGVYL